MALGARILADSISRLGHRLTTFEITFWRSILAEVNTHRILSRNSASSRAVPVAKMIRRLLLDPFVPTRFGINQPGMQSDHFLTGTKDAEARLIWKRGRDRDILTAFELLVGTELAGRLVGLTPDFDDEATRGVLLGALDNFEQLLKSDPEEANRRYLNVHKQYANRRIEVDNWHTIIITGTEWSNFYALRTHKDAQPEFREVASLMVELYQSAKPQVVYPGQWHLPLIELDPGGRDYDDWVRDRDPIFWAGVSAARCARVSYLTHDTATRNLLKDMGLHNALVGSGHMSPLEHQATPLSRIEYGNNPWSGNYRGWKQYRKLIPNESDFAWAQATKSM